MRGVWCGVVWRVAQFVLTVFNRTERRWWKVSRSFDMVSTVVVAFAVEFFKLEKRVLGEASSALAECAEKCMAVSASVRCEGFWFYLLF